MPEIVLPTPPRLPDRDGGASVLTSILPMLGSVVSIAVISGVGGGGQRALVGGAAFLATSLLVAGLQLDRQHRKAKRIIDEQREDYLEQLAPLRRQVRATAADQWRAGWSSEVVEPGDPAYLTVRVGAAPQPLAATLTTPRDSELRRADPALADAVRRFAATHATVPDLPVIVSLPETDRIGLGADAGLARAVVIDALTRHAPGTIAVVRPVGDPEWGWLDWLPAVENPQHTLAIGDATTTSGPTTVLDQTAPADPRITSVGISRATAEAHARRLARRPGPHTVLTRDPLDLIATGGDLAVTIGTRDDGTPLTLDIDEAARGGVGPHGLVVGATGSGKSELLRTLVLGLAMTHRPDEVNLLLIDFKGGATFGGLEQLPHVAGVVTNLADDLALVDRVAKSLAGELQHRQEVLAEAGLGSRRDLPPGHLPALVVVVDEFTELLTARPDFLDVFVAIGRLGRSLGIHLVLATQRLEEGRLRGLESHLSWRIALRTFSAAESRAAIGTPDAFTLPAAPGRALLRTDAAEPVAWQGISLAADLDRALARVQPGPPARPVWLPPLADSPLLSTLRTAGAIGVLDLPSRQAQPPLVLDLSGAGGHVAVIGAPRAGKTSMLTTLVTALAKEQSPSDLEVYAVGQLPGLDALAHTRAVAIEAELVRRVVHRVARLVEERERASTSATKVLLVVDGWGRLLADHPELATPLQEIATRGLACGVHLVVSALRWSDIRPAVRDLFGSRLELRLGDVHDSLVDRRTAATVPSDRPGRGITSTGDHFLAAVVDPAARQVAIGWPDPPVRRLRPLPDQVDPAGLPPGTFARDEEHDPVPVPTHLVVSGSAGSGRTTTLRAIARAVTERADPQSTQVFAVDARRSLLGVVPDEQLAQHATGSAATQAVGDLAAYLARRLPPPGISADELRNRTWWTGAEVWLLVDDADLLPPGALAPLTNLIPHADEVGLHVVLAQRTRDLLATRLTELGAAHLELDVPPGRGDLTRLRETSRIQVTNS